MAVASNITQADLIRLNLHLLPRLRINQILFGFFFVCGMYGALEDVPALIPGDLVIAIVTSIALSVLALLACTAIGLIFQYASFSKNDGILGEHTYSISEEGFRERTVANETLHRWGSVRHVYRTPKHMFVMVSAHLFHVIPRRSFSDQRGFDLFHGQLLNFQTQAQPPDKRI
jgi:hypothetical protein